MQLLSVAGSLPVFLDFGRNAWRKIMPPTRPRAGRPDDHVLVVVQLAGGNDGLNTVVPLGNDDYYKARPRIGIAQKAAHKLTDQWGVHPAATGFKKLYDAGELAVVHAVGYPNANRSHFRATDIWTTASPSGWATPAGWADTATHAAAARIRATPISRSIRQSRSPWIASRPRPCWAPSTCR